MGARGRCLVYVSLTQASVIWKEGTTIEKIPTKDLAVGFLQLVIDMGSPLYWGWSNPSACDPRFYNRTGWASYDEQVGM